MSSTLPIAMGVPGQSLEFGVKTNPPQQQDENVGDGATIQPRYEQVKELLIGKPTFRPNRTRPINR